MREMPAYSPPRGRIFGWIAEIGEELPEEVQRRLRAAFFTSRGPLIVGALNTIAVAGIVYAHTLRPVFLVLALCDLLLLCARALLLRRVNAPSDMIFATGLLWTAVQGSTIWLVVQSGDPVLSILVLATGLAAIGGIIGRNFAAPRYAMAQIMILDGSYKIAFSLQHPEFLPLIAFQTVVFVMMNLGIIRQHRQAAIEAIQGQMDSREQALADPLTSLGNRRALEAAFGRLRPPRQGRALLYLDLDGFKQVNDSLGHAAGDTLLCEIGRRLRDTVGEAGMACRLGGDEFLVLVPDASACDVGDLGARLVAALSKPCQIDKGLVAEVGVSVGAAIDTTGKARLDSLLMASDRALYVVKTSGKGRCLVWEEPEQGAAAIAAE